jgi:hypothetical protein
MNDNLNYLANISLFSKILFSNEYLIIPTYSKLIYTSKVKFGHFKYYFLDLYLPFLHFLIDNISVSALI